jgi:hypothetical protein
VGVRKTNLFRNKYMNITKAILYVSFLIIICPYTYGNSEPSSFSIPTLKRSYFQLDSQGANLKLDKTNLPYPGESDEYVISSSFSPQDTVFFVVDPWDNMPSSFLNEYYGKITTSYILPLIQKAAQSGFKIFIFTNKCGEIKPIPYSCSIPKQFFNLRERYKSVEIVFWQDIGNAQDFIEHIKSIGVKKIIYTGFASNMCILYRPIGMAKMSNLGFLLYFIPKASAAVETVKTWKNEEIHKITSIIISQGLGGLIEYEDILLAIQRKK